MQLFSWSGPEPGVGKRHLQVDREFLQIALLEGRAAFCRGAMVIVVIHLVVPDCCKGGTRFAISPQLQQALCGSCSARSRPQSDPRQFPLFVLEIAGTSLLR